MAHKTEKLSPGHPLYIPPYRGQPSNKEEETALEPIYDRWFLLGYFENNIYRRLYRVESSIEFSEGLEIRTLSKGENFPKRGLASLKQNEINPNDPDLTKVIIDAEGNVTAYFDRSPHSDLGLEIINCIPFFAVQTQNRIRRIPENNAGLIGESLEDIVYDPLYSSPSSLEGTSPVTNHSSLGGVTEGSEGSESPGEEEILSADCFLILRRTGRQNLFLQRESHSETGSPVLPKTGLANRATHHKTPSEEDLLVEGARKNALDQARRSQTPPGSSSSAHGKRIAAKKKSKATTAHLSRKPRTPSNSPSSPSQRKQVPEFLREAVDRQRGAPVGDKKKPIASDTKVSPVLNQAISSPRKQIAGSRQRGGAVEAATASETKVSLAAQGVVVSQNQQSRNLIRRLNGQPRSRSATRSDPEDPSSNKASTVARQSFKGRRPLALVKNKRGVRASRNTKAQGNRFG